MRQKNIGKNHYRYKNVVEKKSWKTNFMCGQAKIQTDLSF